MSKIYLIEIIDGITVIRFSKRPEMSDWSGVFEDVANIDRHGLRLWNLNSCGLENLTYSEIQELALLGKQIFQTPGKAAIVVASDLAYGLARVHDVYREQENYEIMVFRTEQEAFVWLQKVTG